MAWFDGWMIPFVSGLLQIAGFFHLLAVSFGYTSSLRSVKYLMLSSQA